RRMLAKDPNTRPANGDEIVRMLDALPALPDAPRRVRRAPSKREALPEGETMVVRVSDTPRPRKTMSIVLAATPEDEDAVGPAAARSEGETQAVREAGALRGGEAEFLSDGGVVVVLRGLESPAEQATRAGQCALALHELRPDAALMVATQAM